MPKFFGSSGPLDLGIETMTRYLCRNQTGKFPKLGQVGERQKDRN